MPDDTWMRVLILNLQSQPPKVWSVILNLPKCGVCDSQRLLNRRNRRRVNATTTTHPEAHI